MRIALCLGGAACLSKDVAAVPIEYHGVIACNDAGVWWSGELDAWATLHPENMEEWVARRRSNGLPDAKKIISHSVGRRGSGVNVLTDLKFPGMKYAGSSGLFMAKVALVDLGFDGVLLCGVPLTKTPHFFDDVKWDCSEQYREEWSHIPDRYRVRMRSMSGWTRNFLGGP